MFQSLKIATALKITPQWQWLITHDTTVIKVDLMSISRHKQQSMKLARIHATSNNLTLNFRPCLKCSTVWSSKSIKCITDGGKVRVFVLAKRNFSTGSHLYSNVTRDAFFVREKSMKNKSNEIINYNKLQKCWKFREKTLELHPSFNSVTSTRLVTSRGAYSLEAFTNAWTEGKPSSLLSSRVCSTSSEQCSSLSSTRQSLLMKYSYNEHKRIGFL